MARAIDVDRVKREIRKNKEKIVISCKQKYVPLSLIYEILNKAPTLTQPNEPLTCEGCIYEHNEHENCNYCKRAPYLGDYYYRRPPEGEEDT